MSSFKRTKALALLLALTACSNPDTEPRNDGESVRATTISTELAVDPVAHPRPVAGLRPAVAFSGTQYLVAWEDRRLYRSVLYAGRIAADGSSLDPFGIPLLGADPEAPIPTTIYRFAAGSDGADFLLVTVVAEQLLGLRINAAGERLDADAIVIANEVSQAAVPSLRFDGEQYLVVWTDDGHIRWARVTPDGTVLDPEGVNGLPAASLRSGVSFDGSNYLLGWTELEANKRVIAIGRVAPDGTQLDEASIQVSPVGLNVSANAGPVLGFDGTNHVIAWAQASGSDYQIRASRVTPELEILDPDGMLLFSDYAGFVDVHRLDLGAGNGRSIVAWSVDGTDDGGDWAEHVRAAQIEADGSFSLHPEDTFPRGVETIVAAHSDGALLLWRDGVELYESDGAIVGTRLDAQGSPVGGNQISPAAPASRQSVQGIASDGQDFFVLWTDNRNDPQAQGRVLFGTRVAATGAALDLEPIPISVGQPDWVSVVFDGANYLVTWVETTFAQDGWIDKTVRVSPAGELLDDVPLDLALEFRAGASDGTHTLLVGESFPNDLAAVLVDHDLAPVSDIVAIVNDGWIGGPNVTFDGAGYLVAWHEYTKVLGQRVSKAGALEGERFTIMNGTSVESLAVAYGGGTHLVVRQDANGQGVWATRVSPTGQVLDLDNIFIGTAHPFFAGRELAFDGMNFVVAWRAMSVADDWSSLDLYASEVSPDGQVSSQHPLSAAPEAEGVPFLAGANGHVLAAYSRFVPGPPYGEYRAQARLFTTLPAIDLDVQAGGPQTPSDEQTLPSPHSASDVHGGFLPAGGPAGGSVSAPVSPAASAQASSPM